MGYGANWYGAAWDDNQDFRFNPYASYEDDTVENSSENVDTSYNSKGLPLRAGQSPCTFYLKTGDCNYGKDCIWDHPESVGAKGSGASSASANSAGLPKRPGETPCAFYIKTGQCKFGPTCKFDHPEDGFSADTAALIKMTAHTSSNRSRAGAEGFNELGYPLNQGAPECAFFLKTGTCRFGPTCKFSHPSKQGAGAGEDASFEAMVKSARSEIDGGDSYEAMVAAAAGASTTSSLPVRPTARPSSVPVPSSAAAAWVPQTGGVTPSVGTWVPQTGGGTPSAGTNSAGLPIRPGETPCAFFIKTGQCKFGGSCRFDHPENGGVDSGEDGFTEFSGRGSSFSGSTYAEYGFTAGDANGGLNLMGFPLRPGQKPCAFYVKTGECKYGATCVWDHPDPGSPELAQAMASSSSGAALNEFGYPLNPGAPECSFYMKTGTCKFGATCKFSHPSDRGGVSSAAGDVDPFEEALRLFDEAGAGLDPSAALMAQAAGDGSPLSSQGLPMRPGSPPCSFFIRTGKCSYGPTCKWDHPEGQGGSGNLQVVEGLPERPGEPPCAFYLKNGTCSFGATCKFDHPAGLGATAAASLGGGGGGRGPAPAALNSKGFALRPGETACPFYMRSGSCMFGPTCKFDHPEEGDRKSVV